MLVSANIIIARFFIARLDLTAEHLYTLSPGTLRTLAQIDEPITLRFYYSNRLGDEVPAYGVYAQRVRELLEQYVAAAHGKLRLEIFNPAAVFRCRGPGRRLRLAGGAARRRGRPGLFRPRRDQFDRRSAGHPVLFTRARALSRIRFDQARPQPRVSEKDRGRADQQPAARGRHGGDDAGPAEPADGGPRAIAAARQGRAAGGDNSMRSRPMSTC